MTSLIYFWLTQYSSAGPPSENYFSVNGYTVECTPHRDESLLRRATGVLMVDAKDLVDKVRKDHYPNWPELVPD